jgi:hypothetical protein
MRQREPTENKQDKQEEANCSHRFSLDFPSGLHLNYVFLTGSFCLLLAWLTH